MNLPCCALCDPPLSGGAVLTRVILGLSTFCTFYRPHQRVIYSPDRQYQSQLNYARKMVIVQCNHGKLLDLSSVLFLFVTQYHKETIVLSPSLLLYVSNPADNVLTEHIIPLFVYENPGHILATRSSSALCVATGIIYGVTTHSMSDFVGLTLFLFVWLNVFCLLQQRPL